MRRNRTKPETAFWEHEPNALRLPNITQSSGTRLVIPLLDRGEGGYR
jgi:hypothetical protein